MHHWVDKFRWAASAAARAEWLPTTCLLCAAATRGPADLCPGCAAELPALERPCRRCGLPMAERAACDFCMREDWPVQRCVALAAYAAPIDQMINAFKHHAGLVTGRSLSVLLAQRLRCDYADDTLPEALAPVPMHWQRRLRRGFDQAHEIARTLGRQLTLPVAAQACRRVRATAPQQTLDSAGRRRNMRWAFACRPTGHRHIALVDDVVTTGTTAAALARRLRACGVERVDLWCLARTAAVEVAGSRQPQRARRWADLGLRRADGS